MQHAAVITETNNGLGMMFIDLKKDKEKALFVVSENNGIKAGQIEAN